MRSIVMIAAMTLGATSAFAQIGSAGPSHPMLSGGADGVERVQWRDDGRDRRDGRDWDRQDRDWDQRDRDWDRREPYRGPVIRFGAPGYFVRTLPEVVRVVRYDGLPCRITVTRRVTYRGDIVETERRRCPGRRDVVIERR
jgi:hypothetical protein